MIGKDGKELGNPGDPFDSDLWPKPEITQCGTRLTASSCSSALRNGSDANQTALV